MATAVIEIDNFTCKVTKSVSFVTFYTKLIPAINMCVVFFSDSIYLQLRSFGMMREVQIEVSAF